MDGHKKQEVERAGIVINTILGVNLDTRKNPEINRQLTNPKTLKPIKLTSKTFKEALKNKEEADLKSKRQSIANASLKSAASNSIKELQKLKSSQQNIPEKNNKCDVTIPKISRLHVNKPSEAPYIDTRNQSISPVRGRVIQKQSTFIGNSEDDLNLYSFSNLLENEADEQNQPDSTEIIDSKHDSNIKKGDSFLKNIKRPASRITIDASTIIENAKINTTTTNDNEKSVFLEHDYNSGTRPHSAKFSHASTGRLLNVNELSKKLSPKSPLRSGGHSKTVETAESFTVQKLDYDSTASHIFLNPSARSPSLKMSARVGKPGSILSSKITPSTGNENEAANSNNLNGSHWFGGDAIDNGDMPETEDFAIREEEEEELERDDMTVPPPPQTISVEPKILEEHVQFTSIEEVDLVLKKYDVFWKNRAKLLRNEPLNSPTQAEEINVANFGAAKMSNELVEEFKEIKENLQEGEEHKITHDSTISDPERVQSGRKITFSASSKIDANFNTSRRGTASARSSSRYDSAASYAADESDIFEDNETGSDIVSSESDSIRQSMVITSLQRLSENKKRKSEYHINSKRSSIKLDRQQSLQSSGVQIPTPKIDFKNDMETDETSKFPPFAKMNSPSTYNHSFRAPGELLPPRSRHLSFNPTIDSSKPMVLDDWYLDENAYSNMTKDTAGWSQILEDRGPPVAIVPERPHIPGLKPHPTHHHEHHEHEEAHAANIFSCDPQKEVKYAEVVKAEELLAQGNRPKYVAPKNIFGSSILNTERPDSQEPFADSTSILVPTHSDLKIAGKSVQIVPIGIGASSVGLGLHWSPAPPKMSLPLKVYQHLHSVPQTPRSFSRQSQKSRKQIDDKSKDKEFSFQDMHINEKLNPLTQPIQISKVLKAESLSEQTLETMLVNESEWVQTSSVILPASDFFDATEPTYNFDNMASRFYSPSHSVIAEEPQDISAEAAETSFIEAEESSSPVEVPVAQPEIQSFAEEPKVSTSTLLRSNSSFKTSRAQHGSTLPKKPRLYSSDTETQAKTTANIQLPQKKRSQSQPPRPKKKMLPLKKKSEKFRMASTSSSTYSINGIGAAETITSSSMSISVRESQASLAPSDLSQDPAAFYKKRRQSRAQMSSAGSQQPSSYDLSSSSFQMSSSSSFQSGVAVERREDKKRALYEEPKGPDWYVLVHDDTNREKLFTPGERAKYPTLTDQGPPDELSILEGDSSIDPVGEIEKLTKLIMASNLPIPAFLRRRGILLGRVKRYDEALADLMKALQYGRVKLSHYGAFLSKAKIYEELTVEERSSGLPLEPATLGLIKLAIVNYSQIIRMKPDEAEGYYRRACLFEAENEMVYANEDFRMVRELDPKNEHAIHNLAVYSFQRELWDDGIQAFTKLIQLNPENGQAYLYRGRANAYLAKWEEGLRDLTLAVQLAPDRADVYFYRGCLLRERNKRKAIEDFSVSVLLDDGPTNAEAFFQRAMIYYKLKKYELAAIDYVTVVELEPTKALAWQNLGILYMRFFDDYHRALDCFDKSIIHDPIQIKSYLCRGDLLQILHSESSQDIEVLSRGNTDKRSKKLKKAAAIANALNYLERAIKDYSKAMHLCPNAIYDFYSAFELNPGIAQTFMQRTLVLSFQRKYYQIIAEFNERIKHERLDDASLYVLVAKARIKCGDNEGAIRDLSKALEFSKSKDPQIANLYLQKGICYETIKDWQNAIAEYTKCIVVDPLFSKAYYRRGICKLHDGNEKGAADLDIAIKLESKYFEAYLSRASYNQLKGNFAEGIEDCNSALRLEPSSIRAHLIRGACNCKIHQFGLAIADFTKAIHLDKMCHFAFYNRAVTYQLLEDYKNAIKDYSIVLLICDDSNAYRNRGLIYWKQGDAENALLDLYAARDYFPGDARLHGLLALCLQKVGRTEESLEAFSSSIKVNQTLTEALLGRGNVHASIGNCASAKRDYARVMHMYPLCTEAYINMAYTFQMQGRYQKSWDLFTRALAVDPECTSALEGRAVVNYTMQNHFGALIDISQAIKLLPKNPEYLTNRAVIYTALKDYTKALQDNQLALKIDPTYALAYFNIANLYFGQSRWETALQFFNKSLEYDPEDDAAFLNRGITRAQLNDLEGALEDLNIANSMNPQSAEVYFNRAQLFQKQGNYEKADKDFSMVLTLSPQDPSAHHARAKVRGKQGRVLESMEDYAKDIVSEKDVLENLL
ncbi:cytochrome c oxidase subunit 1 [Physocladia obscura]|uniref:Cytochrome c oxidase subunit 1 n=1 Tax=Physocladia obscura TaxID=109957 RepID=A0AAD5T299_9FUNG|nr:cytochrome c oxidase subunit 1 [Physocladia obscura]